MNQHTNEVPDAETIANIEERMLSLKDCLDFKELVAGWYGVDAAELGRGQYCRLPGIWVLQQEGGGGRPTGGQILQGHEWSNSCQNSCHENSVWCCNRLSHCLHPQCSDH